MEKLTAAESVGAGISRGDGASEMLSVNGRYHVVCVGEDGNVRWEDDIENLVVTVGKNDLLDKYLAGSSYTAAWYMGLVDNTSFTAYAAGDTLASHSGWLEVVSGYTISGSTTNRATVAWNAASAGSKASTATAFTITASNTILGCLLTTTQARNTTPNGGAGVLLSAGSFSGGSRAVVNGDTLNVTYTLSV